MATWASKKWEVSEDAHKQKNFLTTQLALGLKISTYRRENKILGSWEIPYLLFYFFSLQKQHTESLLLPVIKY